MHGITYQSVYLYSQLIPYYIYLDHAASMRNMSIMYTEILFGDRFSFTRMHSHTCMHVAMYNTDSTTNLSTG